jgi:hypothetical protein
VLVRDLVGCTSEVPHLRRTVARCAARDDIESPADRTRSAA